MSNKRVLLFANFFDGFLKNASSLRLANELRKDGYEVKQIHHFINFSYEELKEILQDFCKDRQSVVCVSTSFLSEEEDRNNIQFPTWGKTDRGYDVFTKIMYVCAMAKSYGAKVVMGGWVIDSKKFKRRTLKEQWKFDKLEEFVDLFVEGMGSSVIKKLVNNEPQNYIVGKLVNSDPVADYSDVSTAPTKEDYISPKESLYFEIASGCIFSCHFCNFGSLGKKKNEYMRSYESLKAEIVSNYENFGTRMYNVTDNIVNDYLEKLRMLIRIKNETGIDLKWSGYVRLDTIKTKEHADLLLESGMIGALMGIESFTPSVGRYIGKMTDKDRLVEILQMCRESWKDNAIVSAMFIAGLPTETVPMLEDTLEYLVSNEGRNLIDTFRFNRFHVDHSFDDKNEINKARNSPFKDYELLPGSYGSNWTSPWSNSDEILKFVKVANDRRYKKSELNTQNICHVANLGYTPEQVVALARKGVRFTDIRYRARSAELIDDYRARIMADLKKS